MQQSRIVTMMQLALGIVTVMQLASVLPQVRHLRNDAFFHPLSKSMRQLSVRLHASNTDPYMWEYNGSWQQLQLQGSKLMQLGQPREQHSQAGQDWLVNAVLGCVYEGYYVDLAANDAKHFSNTLMLERDFRWDGVCVEANPGYFQGLANRKCRLVGAAVGSPTDTPVQFQFNGGFGGIVAPATDNQHVTDPSQVVNLKTIALGDLLDKLHAPISIDYMSLDVEGAESMVMKDFPFGKYQFKLITIERPKPDLVELLHQNGYEQLRRNSGFRDTTWIHTRSMGSTVEELRKQWTNGAPKKTTCMEQLGYTWPTTLAA